MDKAENNEMYAWRGDVFWVDFAVVVVVESDEWIDI